MKYSHLTFVTIAIALFAIGGCSPYLHSPPARMISSETAKALNKGETAVQVQAGVGAGSEIGIIAANLRVRHGVGQNLDVSGEFSYAQIDVNFRNALDAILSGRVGIKYAFTDYVALGAGVAGGGWAGGGFISPDLKLIVSAENPKFVPYLDFGAFTSHPFAEEVVAYGGGAEGPDAGLPPFTFGWTVGAGFRVPIRRIPDRTNHGILFGFRYIGVRFDNPVGADFDRGTRNEPYLTFSLGYEHVFGKKR